MLPTLNLQLTSLESLDASLSSPTLTPAGDAGVRAAGFAELLRFRVDSALAEAWPSGQLLPQPGRELPVAPERVAVELIAGLGEERAVEALPTMEIDTWYAPDGMPPASTDLQIGVQVPLSYPALDDTGIEALQATEIATSPVSLPPALAAPGLETANLVQVSAPEAVIAPTAAVNAESDRALPPAVPLIRHEGLATLPDDAPAVNVNRSAARGSESVLQQRVPLVTPETIASDPATIRDEHRPVIDVGRRPESAPLQTAMNSTEEISDVFKARPAVVQTVQVLNAQANPQQPQPMFNVSPTVQSSGEASYAAAAKQASDMISVPVRDAGWGNQLGERVLLMAGNQVRTAEIRLTPAELGPLRVLVAIDDGAANVTFQAQHAVTREAIEQALPRLREMLAENGLSLGQADVGEHGVSERNREQHKTDRLAAGPGDDGPEVADEESQSSRRVSLGNGLVDTFA